MKISKICVFFITMLLVGCYSSNAQKMLKDMKKDRKANMEKSPEEVVITKGGNQLYNKKVEPHYVPFRKLKGNSVALYSERNKFSEVIVLLNSHNYLQLVNGKLGLTLTRVRVYDKQRGYIEGYINNDFFRNREYYGEPYQLSQAEIDRRAALAERLEKAKKARKEKLAQLRREKHYKNIVQKSREDSKRILGLSYTELKAYFKDYKEDPIYTENATKTLKFDKGNNLLYVTLGEGKVIGFLLVNNVEAISEEEKDIFLYETLGEISYNINDEQEIGTAILKQFASLDDSGYDLILKKDKNKPNPYIFVQVAEFSGIE